MTRQTTMAATDSDGSPSGSQSVGRALALLRLVAGKNRTGVGLTQAMEASGLSKATVHRLLKEMLGSGLLMQGSHRRYHLGQFAYELGMVASSHFQVREICAPFLERIAADTGDTVFLVMRSGNDSFCLDRHSGSFPIKVYTVEVGNRQPLGVGAGGLALLSFLTGPERSEVLEAIEDRIPSYQGLSRGALEHAIDQTRQSGHSLIANHVVQGVTGVGVPVLDRIGRPIVAVSVATISSRLETDRRERVLQTLRQEAKGMRDELLNHLLPTR